MDVVWDSLDYQRQYINAPDYITNLIFIKNGEMNCYNFNFCRNKTNPVKKEECNMAAAHADLETERIVQRNGAV